MVGELMNSGRVDFQFNGKGVSTWEPSDKFQQFLCELLDLDDVSTVPFGIVA